MQIIITQRCENCGKPVRTYNKKHTYYFGPQVHECPNCKHVFFDPNAIELSTRSKQSVTSHCKDYVLEGQNFLCFAIFVVVLSLASVIKSEAWVNQTENILLLGLLGFGIPFAIKCIIKYFYFWNVIYKSSEDRMNDMRYMKLKETYDREIERKYKYQ